MKILLLEDDPVLSELMTDFLREHYAVEHAYSSNQAREYIDTDTFDLYIFDINVPGSSGLSMLEELRESRDMTPVIIITAYQDIDHLRRGYDHGCDDYLKKPFDLEELLLRVKHIQKQHCPQDERVLCNGCVLDPLKHQIIKDGERYTITPKENEILLYMAAHSKRIVSTNELVNHVWSYDEIPSDTTLRGYIKNLRDILGKECIQTVRAEGYIYDASR